MSMYNPTLLDLICTDRFKAHFKCAIHIVNETLTETYLTSFLSIWEKKYYNAVSNDSGINIQFHVIK